MGVEFVLLFQKLADHQLYFRDLPAALFMLEAMKPQKVVS
jgi:hypothetical protein